ncbi:MAG TPA: PAS domain S-box protein [Longimicrobium sp.]|nr:PAS domain S-box protein [Longimicrobium sp.]
MFDSAPDAYLLLAPDPPRFTMVAANEARLRVTMTRREDVVGRPLFEVFPDNPTDPGATGVRNLQASLNEVLRTGRPHRMALQKYDIRTPAGEFEERYWDPLNSPVFDDRGKLIYIIHRVEDVTEQVRSGSRLRILESVVTTANDAVVVTEPEPLDGRGPRIFYVNEAFTRMTGYAPGEVVGRTPRILQGPGTAPDTTRRIRAALERREPVRAELLNYRKDGSPYWVEISIAPVLDESGRVVQWTSVQRETTARREAEETALRLTRETAARAEEARARQEIESILESITDAFYAVDREWRFTYLNRRAEEVLRRRREELVGRSVWEVFPEAVGTAFEREYRRSMAEQTTAEFEAFYAPLGICVEVRAYPSPEALSVYLRDITDRKRAERALRESEERYRLLADMIPQHIWTTDANGFHDYFSRRWYEFTGMTPEQTEGEGWLHLLHPGDRERTLARWRHSLRTGEPYAVEYRFRRADGVYCWFLGQAAPLRDEAGEILSWFGTLTDISERKRHDEERERLLEGEREARAQVTTILESITDAFFAVDRVWRFTYVNREAERLLKRAREELLGHSLWEEFSGAVGSTFQHEYQRAVAERTTVQFEAYAPTIGIWVDARAYPSSDGLSVFFRDVSARKRAEEKLRESERSFRALANTIPQLAWMADPTGWIFWYNERWHEYTGTTLEEMQGWGWRKVHHPEHVDRVVERIRHAFETGTRWEDTFPLRSKTGAYRWFLSRALPIKDGDGNVVRWFGTNTDVTDQIEAVAERERLLDRANEARAEAERRREEVERVTESRTRLMRGFTHDVKNPLGAADGYAQLLEDGILGELSTQQVESIRRIRRSIRTSLHLIHELLELARAEAGQIELEPVLTDVAELAREAAEDFRAQAAGAGLGLEVRADGALRAETDPARVRQILSNLLSNAVKYTPQGRVTVEAGRRTGGSGPGGGDWIAVRVTDTGPGIPAEKQETIFQEFTRLDPEAQHGAGVGLAISRRIARLLGGDITVESEGGRGSAFTLWLPPASPSREATGSAA